MLEVTRKAGWSDDVAVYSSDLIALSVCKREKPLAVTSSCRLWPVSRLFVTQESGRAVVVPLCPRGPHPVTAPLPLAC